MQRHGPYASTGSTPARHEFNYPTVFTKTEPHDVLLLRYRQSQQDTIAAEGAVTGNTPSETEEPATDVATIGTATTADGTIPVESSNETAAVDTPSLLVEKAGSNGGKAEGTVQEKQIKGKPMAMATEESSSSSSISVSSTSKTPTSASSKKPSSSSACGSKSVLRGLFVVCVQLFVHLLDKLLLTCFVLWYVSSFISMKERNKDNESYVFTVPFFWGGALALLLFFFLFLIR